MNSEQEFSDALRQINKLLPETPPYQGTRDSDRRCGDVWVESGLGGAVAVVCWKKDTHRIERHEFTSRDEATKCLQRIGDFNWRHMGAPFPSF